MLQYTIYKAIYYFLQISALYVVLAQVLYYNSICGYNTNICNVLDAGRSKIG